MPISTCCGGRVYKQWQTFLSLSEFGYGWKEFSSRRSEFACIWRSKRDGIMMIKIEKMQSHFSSNVFTAISHRGILNSLIFMKARSIQAWIPVERSYCLQIQLNNTKHFCAQSGGSIHLTIWKWVSGELGYPGALPPMLENSCCTFSPGPTDSSWVSEDSVHLAWMLKHTVHFWKSVMWELCWVAGTKVPQINTKLIFLKANSKLLTFFFPKHTQILQISELS